MMGIGDVKDLDEYEKKRMIAEVKMLKAYFHFYLLSYYGPICPLRESPAVNAVSYTHLDVYKRQRKIPMTRF